MTVQQAINLLDNGIMPCILYGSSSFLPPSGPKKGTTNNNNINSYSIDFICGFYNNNYENYTFYTLKGNQYYAYGLNEEIIINYNGGGES